MRPLGLGCTWDKFSDKYLQQKAIDCGDVKRALHPAQYGVKTPGGTEVPVHNVRNWLLGGDDVITTDFAKAFQTVDHGTLARIVSTKMPYLLRKVLWMTENVNVFVRMEDGTVRTIVMTNGVAQGRVLSSLACCLVISVFLPALVHDICLLTGLPEDDSVLAYIDDMTFRLPPRRPDLFSPILDLVQTHAIKGGFWLQKPKCLHITRDGVARRLLGAHVGNDDAVAQQLVDNLDDAAAAFDALPLVGKHAAWDILRSCLAPLAGHSRRTELPHTRVRAAQRLHSQICDVVARLADLPSLSDGQKLIVPLPFEFAGLDIKDAVVVTDDLLDWFPFVASFLFSRAKLRETGITLHIDLIEGLAVAIDGVAKYLNVASVDLLQWDVKRLRHLQRRITAPTRAELAGMLVRDHILPAPEPQCNVLATRFLENTCKTSYAALTAPVFNSGCVYTDTLLLVSCACASLRPRRCPPSLLLIFPLSALVAAPRCSKSLASAMAAWTALSSYAPASPRLKYLTAMGSSTRTSRQLSCQLRKSVLWHTIAPRVLHLPSFTRRRACAALRVVPRATTEYTLHAPVCSGGRGSV